MNKNIFLTMYIGIAFLLSFGVLISFLELYSSNLLTSEKNVIDVDGIFTQNPKDVTIDVLRNLSGETQTDSININSFGFRGDEFSKTKPIETYRIFLLGGSTMFGYGASSDDTTISGYLEDFFQQDERKFDVEVINAGIQGADSSKELLLMKNRLLEFSPDLIIIYDGWNDLRSEVPPDDIFRNWQSMCELGHKYGFDVIISIQPIAGFGSKKLTTQELEYVKTGTNYNDEPLINSIQSYETYVKYSKQLKYCTDVFDFRFIFDKELSQIYLDQGHVLDNGNLLVAKTLHKKISTIIPQTLIPDNASSITNFDNSKSTIYGNFFQSLIPYSPLLIQQHSLIFENLSEDTSKFENLSVKSTSKIFNNSEITINIELISLENTSPNHKKLIISTIDKTNNELISNITYFLQISKDGESLVNDYFFVDDEYLILDVLNTDSEVIEILGERQYDHNAFVVNSNSTLRITGSIFDAIGTYEFNIDLRTIYDPDEWIYSLDGFQTELVILE